MITMTLWEDIKALSEKRWGIAETGGSIGILGIILTIASALLIWKKFLGKFSIWAAFIILVLVAFLHL